MNCLEHAFGDTRLLQHRPHENEERHGGKNMRGTNLLYPVSEDDDDRFPKLCDPKNQCNRHKCEGHRNADEDQPQQHRKHPKGQIHDQATPLFVPVIIR